MERKTIDYAAVGQKIRRLRKARRMTQEQFAELIDRSPSFVGHIERGSRILSLETFLNIVQVLDCSANDLLGIDRVEEKNRINAERLLQLAVELARNQSPD